MLIDFLAKRLGDYITTYSDETRFCCPFCLGIRGTEDKNHHLYVNTVKDRYFCHRCKSKGTVKNLSIKFHVEKVSYNNKDFISELTSILYPKLNEEPEIIKDLPLDYTKIIEGTRAYTYLKSRDINDRDIEYFKIGFGTENIFKLSDNERSNYAGSGRVIFPDYSKDGLEYWVARSYVGHKNKYKNAKWPSVNQLFNINNISKEGRLLVVEGPIDAVVSHKYVGGQVVATYGKYVSHSQLRRLLNEFNGEYYLALDPDAYEDNYKLASELVIRGRTVRIVNMPKNEDPASLKDKINHYIDKSELFYL